MTLRRSAPQAVKVHGRKLSRRVGQATAELRMRPSFVLVGAQRCGTTSLFRALMAHPLVQSPVFHKGINYFDLNY
ncbi:MAG: sulfotransferase, partial [Nocardioidaceae bacterium]